MDERRVADVDVPVERRRGRKMIDSEAMVSVSVCLTPREVRAIRRVAAARGKKLAHVLRVLVRRGIKSNQFDATDPSLTL